MSSISPIPATTLESNENNLQEEKKNLKRFDDMYTENSKESWKKKRAMEK